MYEERMYYTGNIIEVEKLHTRKYPPKGKREKRGKPTGEAVQKYNEKIAEDYCRRKVHCNFFENDLHIVLGYPKGHRPSTAKIIQDIDGFKGDMRKAYKKAGQLFKYIHVAGYYNKDGIPDSGYDEHDETAMHHHLIVNAIDYRVITKAWKKRGGRVWFYPLDDEGDYTDLANYFIGHTKNLFREVSSPYKKRWSCSRNLIEPPPPKKKIVAASSWREEPKPIQGYKIVTDSIKYGVSEVTGYPYQFYRMVKIKQRR